MRREIVVTNPKLKSNERMSLYIWDGELQMQIGEINPYILNKVMRNIKVSIEFDLEDK